MRKTKYSVQSVVCTFFWTDGGDDGTLRDCSILKSQFFWLIATLGIVASIGIEVWLRTGRTGAPKTERFAALLHGQRQDAWLTCAVVWTVVPSGLCR